jgi:hypothetical protein
MDYFAQRKIIGHGIKLSYIFWIGTKYRTAMNRCYGCNAYQ